MLRQDRNDFGGNAPAIASNAFLRPGYVPGEKINDDFPDGLKLIFVSWLAKYNAALPTGVSVGLWRTVSAEGPGPGPGGGTGRDPMFVVVKRLKAYITQPVPGYDEGYRPDQPRLNESQLRFGAAGLVPGEIAYCDLDVTKSLARGEMLQGTTGGRFLYNALLTSLPQTHAFQVHDYPDEAQNVTHYSKYYNGQHVEKLIEMYKKAKRPVPEAFVWHVIAQLGRAFKFIHTGRTMPDKTAPRGSPRGPPRAGEEEERWQRKEDERAANWTPVSHHDAHAANVFLHFVTDYEREHDREGCLKEFDDCFPQVILGDFGLAMDENSGSGYGRTAFSSDTCPHLPERETWKDKAEFGLMLAHLLLAGLPEVPMFGEAPLPRDWYNQWREWLDQHYSQTLNEVVDRFILLVHMADTMRHGDSLFHEMVEYHYDLWQDGWRLDLAPFNEWFHYTMIDVADDQLDFLRDSGQGSEDVRWATGQRMSNMPYQVPNRTKYSEKKRLLVREDSEDEEGELTVVAVPMDCKETLRTKARTIYNRKLRRPITAAFYRHPPDHPDRVDKDKLWVSKTYRLERIRYRRNLAINLEAALKGGEGCRNKFTPPPSPGEVERIETRMFRAPDAWGSDMLHWDREGRGDGDTSPSLPSWSDFGQVQEEEEVQEVEEEDEEDEEGWE